MVQPTIIVLDGYTLTSNIDVSPDWSLFKSLGEMIVYDRTLPHQVVTRAASASMVLTNKTPLHADMFSQLPHLNYIGVLATGVNNVDLSAARRYGVTVTNVPGYSTDSAAQHTFALLLEIASHTGSHHQAVCEGRWVQCPDFSFTVAPIIELSGKILGIIGLGQIGQRVAQIAATFGMNIVVAAHPSTDQIHVPGVSVERLPFKDLLPVVDVLTLHCPLTNETHQMINSTRLANMKPTAILINTSRGQLIDETALSHALHRGVIAGAGIDVLGEEPPTADNPLLTTPHCIITPHIAWASAAARARLMDLAFQNVRAFLNGSPINVVN